MRRVRRIVAKAKKQPKVLPRAELFPKIQAICEIVDSVPGQQRNSLNAILRDLYEGSCHDGS